MKLKAEFSDRAAVAPAVRALREAGFGPQAIDLYSTQPLDLGPGVLDRPSHMSRFAVAGAIISGGLATAFMFYTQLDYPIATGGMPLTSGWATGVITFELTMAGAVAGTVAGLLWEGRFFRQSNHAPMLMEEGNVYMQVTCEKRSIEQAGETVRKYGGQIVENWSTHL